MIKQVKQYQELGEYKIILKYDQEGMQREWVGIVRAEKAGEYKLHVQAEHTAKNTGGRVVVKAIGRNGAMVTLSGMIKIYKQAQGTDNFLELRVLLLDDKSRATVDPKLEIEANEVKAGHAASVSRIDEEEVQYLMARGIGRVAAEEMIIEGWLV